MTRSPDFADTDQNSSFVQQVLEAVPEILGFTPSSSVVLVLLDGQTMGPSLRVDIPYGIGSCTQWASRLIAMMPREVEGMLGFIICYESGFQESPEWYEDLFVALGTELEKRGVKPQEVWWVTSDGEAGLAPQSLSPLRVLTERVGPMKPESEARLRSELERPLRQIEEKIGLQRVVEHHPDQLSVDLLGRRLADALSDEQEDFGAVDAIAAIESTELLLSAVRSRDESGPGARRGTKPSPAGKKDKRRQDERGNVAHLSDGADEALLGLVPAAVAFCRALADPIGLELVARCTILGRSEALESVPFRFDLAERQVMEVSDAAAAVAHLLLDPPEDPRSSEEWLSRIPAPEVDDWLTNAGRQAFGEELAGVHPESTLLQCTRSGAFFETLLADIGECRWRDLRALTVLTQLLEQVTPKALSLRLAALTAWAAWIEGRCSVAGAYLEARHLGGKSRRYPEGSSFFQPGVRPATSASGVGLDVSDPLARLVFMVVDRGIIAHAARRGPHS